MRRAGRFVALVVAGVAIGSSCFARVPYNNGFFAPIDGRWMWLGGDRPENALVTDQRMTSGPGGQLMIGYKIADSWDVSLAGDVQTMITSVTQLLGGMLKIDTNRQHVDLEIDGAGMGDETYNKMLATRRAAALQDELRRQGLDSRQIDSINIIF